MDLIEACEIVRRAGDASVDYRIAAAQVLLAELEAGEVTTEWAVRWTDAPEDEQIDHLHPTDDGGQSYARRVHAQYPHKTEVVSREVRRGPWNPVTIGGAS